MGAKQEKENPDLSVVDLDSCREKCRKSRHSRKKGPPSRHAKLFCLQSVAAVSVRTHLWQAVCTLSGWGKEMTHGRKKTSQDDHRYRSEISWKMVPFGMGIGRRWRPRGYQTALRRHQFLIETSGLRADFFPKNYDSASEILETANDKLSEGCIPECFV